MDVSKLSVDITLMCVVDHKKQTPISDRFDNNEAGMKVLDKWLKNYKVSFDKNCLLAIENRGVYHRLIRDYCSKVGLPVYIGNATDINHSFGIAPGKNDKIDSQRFVLMLSRTQTSLKLRQPSILSLSGLKT